MAHFYIGEALYHALSESNSPDVDRPGCFPSLRYE